jgi:hypothetical protein
MINVDTETNRPDSATTAGNQGGRARCYGGFGTPLPRGVRIFIASMILITAVAGVVTHDLLAVLDTQTRLELDAAHMAAAGVEFLPGAPARATLAAAYSAARCGLSPSEVIHADAAADRMSFNVTVQRTAPLLLLRLLGGDMTVTALATAKVRPSATPPNSGGPRSSGGPMVLSARPILSTPPIMSARPIIRKVL